MWKQIVPLTEEPSMQDFHPKWKNQQAAPLTAAARALCPPVSIDAISR